MALSPGLTLGSFEIKAPLGAGGMGEVYRARDTRLQRDVALKLLPEALASDPERVARFEREAHTLAALNHPHIAHVYGFERAGTTLALVMELVEGEDLSEIIARGPVPLDDAVPIARQIAEALEAAHDAGIIHRDLKPANIKVRPDGTVKVLDFGLAKALEPAVASSGDPFASPTITSPAQMTHAGVILGTAAYMSPEQARGRPVDRRTDIWAFGCVLFEMLAGVRAFGGEDVTETLASIMKSDPLMARLPADTPVAIRRVLTRSLQKDRRLRLQHIGDARLDFDEAASGEASAAPSGARDWGWRAGLAVLAIAVAALAGGIGMARWMTPTIPAAAPLQFAIAPPVSTSLTTPSGGGTGVAPQFALSPDGSAIVFVASGERGFQLWYRSLSAVDARVLPGTEGATFPFWSPDSRSVGFFADAKLKRIRIDGGAAQVVCTAESGRGGTWNRDNVILFGPSTTGPLKRVSAAGGAPQDATRLDADYGETAHRFPFFLPDGRHFLYTAAVGSCCPAVKTARIKVGVLGGSESDTLATLESAVIFADGHLLYAEQSNGTLMAWPFDDRTRSLVGDAFAVANGVVSEGSRYASVSASSNGILAYGRGDSSLVSQLTWFDRQGRSLGTVGEPGAILQMSLAPDDRRVAVASVDMPTGNRDIYVFDNVEHTQSRLSFDAGEDDSPVWFSSLQQLLFVSHKPRAWAIVQKAIAQATQPEAVFTQDGDFRRGLYVTDVSPDGSRILFQQTPTQLGQTDIWLLQKGAGAPTPYLQTDASEGDAVFSPDMKWVAYQSNITGQRPSVYVQPYPAAGGVFQISRGIGFKPTWRSDGKELFFVTDDGVMAAAIDTVNGFHAGPPQKLFAVAQFGRIGNTGRNYAVSRDGQRLLANVPRPGSMPQALTVTTNWLSAARK